MYALDSAGVASAHLPDGTAIRLSADGASYLYTTASGEKVNGSTLTAHSAVLPALTAVIAFRNERAPLQPLLVDNLLSEVEAASTFTLPAMIRYCRWPPAARYIDCTSGKNGLTADGSVVVRSTDTVAVLVLAAHLRSFSVTFAAHVHRKENSHNSDQADDYKYMWLTQTFPLSSYPQRWCHPLSLALELAGVTSPQDVLDARLQPDWWKAEGVFCKTPQQQHSDRSGNDDDDNSGFVSTGDCVVVPLPQSVGGATSDLAQSRKSLLNAPATSPHPSTATLVLQSDNIVYYSGYSSLANLPMAFPQNDSSAVEAGGVDGSTLRHYRVIHHTSRPNNDHSDHRDTDASNKSTSSVKWEVHERVYVRGEFPPPSVAARLGYNLADISATLATLVRHNESYEEGVSLAAAEARARGSSSTAVNGQNRFTSGSRSTRGRVPATPEVLSAESVFELSVDGVGRMTAFKDGRVRAVFEDRVVAEMDGSHAYASILSTEGERITVRVEQPVGYEWHLGHMLEFSGWGFASPEERASFLQQTMDAEIAYAKVQAEIEVCKAIAAARGES